MYIESNPYLRREWPNYIVGPDLETVGQLDQHPVDSGVYFMFAEDGGLIYIGLSLGIQYRQVQHYWAGRRCAGYGAVYVPADLMHAVEIAYIDALQPPLNVRMDQPPWLDLHEKMVRAILACWEPGPMLPVSA